MLSQCCDESRIRDEDSVAPAMMPHSDYCLNLVVDIIRRVGKSNNRNFLMQKCNDIFSCRISGDKSCFLCSRVVQTDTLARVAWTAALSCADLALMSANTSRGVRRFGEKKARGNHPYMRTYMKHSCLLKQTTTYLLF